MAQLALTAAGMAVGASFGNPQLGAAAGALAGAGLNWLLDPSAGKPRIHDKAVQVSAYGQRISKLYGTSRIAGILAWSGGLTPHAKSSSLGGGKGLGAQATNYVYTASFQIVLCEGPIAGIGRVWGDGKLIVDFRAGAYNTLQRRRGATFARYLGTDDQMPDPTIAAWNQGVAPAYRGIAYLMILNLELQDFANRIPNVTVEVIEAGSSATPVLTVTPSLGINVDCMVLDENNGWIYNCPPNGIVKIDTGTAQIVNEVTGVNAGYAAVLGADGYLYAKPSLNGPLYRFDPDTLAQVGLSIADDGGSVPWIGALTELGGFIVGINFWGAFGTNSLSIFTEPDAGGLWGFEMAVTTTTPYRIDWACLDAEGNLWAVARDGSNHLHLYQYQMSFSTLLGGSVVVPILGEAITTAVPGLVGMGLSLFLQAYLSGVTISLALLNDYDVTSAFSDGIYSPVGVAVDFNDGTLLIGWGDSFIKWDPATASVSHPELSTSIYSVGPGNEGGVSQWVRGIVDGLFFSEAATVIDTSNWLIRETIYVAGIVSAAPGPVIYDDTNDSMWMVTSSGNIKEVFLDLVASENVPLSTIVADICDRAGLASDQYDVSSLTEVSVAGFLDSRAHATGRDLLQPLATGFFFDAAEIGGKIVFVLRGSAPGVALTSDDIGAYEGGQQRPEPLEFVIPFESELPLRIWVHHIDPGIDYQQSVQPSKRITNATLLEAMKEQSVELPIVLTAQQAGQIADTLLYLAWTVRQFAFAVSLAQIGCDPTDVITLTVTYPDSGDSPSFILRITQCDLGANKIIQVHAELEDPTLYVASESAGGSPINWQPPVQTPVSPTRVSFLDIPALRDEDAAVAGWYMAAGPVKDVPYSWAGCLVMQSLDNGGSFNNFAIITAEAVQGVATTALAAPRAWTTWDRVNTVTVLPLAEGDLLAGASEAAVLNGTNYALLGDEVIAFADVTQNDDGTYALGTLLRGRRGTDPAVGSHAAGERFVLLTQTTLSRINDSSSLELMRLYKAASLGESTFPESAFQFTDAGENLMPLTVCSITSSRDGDVNLTIDWIRQTRIGGNNDWLDGVTNVPLGETSEAYQIDIIKTGNAVRTLAVTSPTATYSAADQTTDFGEPQSAVAIVIYQISSLVGRGFGAAATV